MGSCLGGRGGILCGRLCGFGRLWRWGGGLGRRRCRSPAGARRPFCVDADGIGDVDGGDEMGGAFWAHPNPARVSAL